MSVGSPFELRDIAVVIGMPRAGTTWLYENLKTHPDICVSDYKEINRYLRPMSDEAYRKLFPADRPGTVKLDVSPLYFFDEAALARIAGLHEKVILIVRESDAWLKSLQSQLRKYGADVDAMIDRNCYEFPVSWNRRVHFDLGRHDLPGYLGRVRRCFGDKLLCIDYADLERDPVRTLNTIEDYLGVRRHFDETTCSAARVNTSGQRMSWLYAFLVRRGIERGLVSIALTVLPRRVIHWLRRRFVYGG